MTDLARKSSATGLLFLAALVSHGQTPVGQFHLLVQDPTGAPMQVSGRLESQALPAGRTFQTDALGSYIFESLPYGVYRVELSKTGFVNQTLTVEVRSPGPLTRSVTMPLRTQAFQADVVSTTPLPGVDVARSEIPAPVQIASANDIAATGANDLSGVLNRRLDGVHMNEMQGNSFQADLNYRGYTASPLLGTPEGLSVYMDGVRLNQPFGDVVSWDLIPSVAISETALMPGSNPMFGLNTLGGALSIQTKNGLSQPGTSVEVSGGAYGRRAVQLEHGGSRNGLNWYLAGNLYHDDGWRDASPSDVRQLFSKAGWQNATTALNLTFAYAYNTLQGNGLQEQRFISQDYSSIYTKPDITHNRSPFFNLSAMHAFSGKLTFSGNAYFRYIRADTYNADINENSLDQSLYQLSTADIAALRAAGYSGFPITGSNASNTPFPYWRCIAQALQKDEPGEKCNGLLTSTYTKQHNYGLAGQMTWLGSPLGQHNRFTAGAAWDRSGVSFQQSQQFAYLNPDRSFTPVEAFADGSTDADGAPLDTRVYLHGLPQTWSLYATDTLSVGAKWSFTLSGRFNRTYIDNVDRLHVAGPGSLNGSYIFDHFNPAAGFTFSPTRWVTGYASFSQGSRAPTSIELGCADPNFPCRLPNASTGDPPLDQVVTRSWEAGVRSGPESHLAWSVGWFRAENHNDLLFVASTQTGYGYFKNFGLTRRQGVELNVSGHVRRATLGGGYTFLDATYQSSETILGSSNSSNSTPGLDGVIQIQPGNRIPLVPRHMLKAYADFQATRKLSLDLDFVAMSSSFARGNENNLSQPDGKYYLGPGRSPGYGVLNFGAHYQLHRRVQLSAQVDNVLDHHFYSAAQLGPTAFTDQGTFIARPYPPVNGDYPIVHATFYAPGAPITAWGAVRFGF